MSARLKIFISLSLIPLAVLGGIFLSIFLANTEALYRLYSGRLNIDAPIFFNYQARSSETVRTAARYLEADSKGAVLADSSKREQAAIKSNYFYIDAPILMYHYIEPVPTKTALPGLYLDPVVFAGQLAEIKNGAYETFFVSELAWGLRQEKKLPAKAIVLSFDDGYEDFYHNVFPLLKKYNFKATLYVIINKLGTPGYVTKEQVKELANSGLVEIGSHTFNHPDLRSLKAKDAGFEVKASEKILSQITGQDILTFAYPFGLYNINLEQLASSTPYLAAVSVESGVRHSSYDLLALKRLRPGERNGEVFRKWLEEAYLMAY